MYHKCAHESHSTCEHLQILSTSMKVLGIQNLDKPVPSGSNLNVCTVINYIDRNIPTGTIYECVI